MPGPRKCLPRERVSFDSDQQKEVFRHHPTAIPFLQRSYDSAFIAFIGSLCGGGLFSVRNKQNAPTLIIDASRGI
jgi:hypothetical protein